MILIEKERYDIWFNLYRYYRAKTELYDRSLTDLQGPYDETEACVIGKNRRYSGDYAISLYRRMKGMALNYGISSSIVFNNKL